MDNFKVTKIDSRNSYNYLLKIQLNLKHCVLEMYRKWLINLYAMINFIIMIN